MVEIREVRLQIYDASPNMNYDALLHAARTVGLSPRISFLFYVCDWVLDQTALDISNIAVTRAGEGHLY